MNIYLALTLFSLIIVVYWIISELFTMLFRFTGLPTEKARFQVTSLLTGCGFTTRESELFLSSRARRQLARVTMLFGYVFNITIVTAFINIFLSMKVSDLLANVMGFSIPLAVCLGLLILSRIPRVRSWTEAKIEHLANRIIHREKENTILLMDSIGKDVIAQVLLSQVPEELQGKTLAESRIKSDYGVLVMLVERGAAVPAEADTVFQQEDRLTVFGDYKTICQVFQAAERFTDSAEG